MKKLARVHPQPLTTDTSDSLSHGAPALSPTSIHAQETHTMSPHMHDVVELQRRRHESVILQTLRRLEIHLDHAVQDECQPMLNILRRKLKADTVVIVHGNVHRVLFDCRHGSPSLFDALTLLQIIREQEVRTNENVPASPKENSSLFSSLSFSAKMPSLRSLSRSISHSRPVTASHSLARSVSHSIAHSIAHSVRNSTHSEREAGSPHSRRSFFSASVAGSTWEESDSDSDSGKAHDYRRPIETTNTDGDAHANNENNQETPFSSPLTRSLVYSRDLQTDRRISALTRTNLDGKIRFFLSTRVRLGPALNRGERGLNHFSGCDCESDDDGSSFQSSFSSRRCHLCDHTQNCRYCCSFKERDSHHDHHHNHHDKSDRRHWCTLLVLASSPRTILSSADLEIFAEISALLEQTYTSHAARHRAQTASSLSLSVSFLSSLQPTLREMHVAAECIRRSYEALATQRKREAESRIGALSDALHTLSEANARFTVDFERIIRCLRSPSPADTHNVYNTHVQHSSYDEVCESGLVFTINEVLLSLSRRHTLTSVVSLHKARSRNLLSRALVPHQPILTHTNALLWQYSSSLTPTFARCVYRTSHDHLSLFLSVLVASASAFACTTKIAIDFEFVRMDKYNHFEAMIPEAVSPHGSWKSAAGVGAVDAGEREKESTAFVSVVEGVLRVCVHFPDKVRVFPEEEVVAISRRIEGLFAWMNTSSPAVAQTLLCGREEEEGDPVVPSSSVWSSLARWNELSHAHSHTQQALHHTHGGVGEQHSNTHTLDERERERDAETEADDRVRVYSLRLPCTMLLTAAQREAMMVGAKTKMHVPLHWGTRGAYKNSEAKERLRQRKQRKLARAKETALKRIEQEKKTAKGRLALPFLCFLRCTPTFVQTIRQRREREKEELLDLGFSRSSMAARKKTKVRCRNRKPK